MLSVIILDSGESKVVQLTYENLFKEIKSMPEAELVVSDNWFTGIKKAHNKYVCFVEADCMVSSGYFSSMIGLFDKSSHMRKLAMLSSAVGVNNWVTRVYGYKLGDSRVDGVIPVTAKISTGVYPIEIGYVPGSIIRTSMLEEALKTLGINKHKGINNVELSTMLSLAFWEQGDGNRVHMNPNSTYVTTENTANEIHHMREHDLKPKQKTLNMFRQECI